jgi:26S proteasome regulatory subunit N9
VEHLVIRAVSVGLIKCTIDEVAQEVNFSYVKPKVLSKAQVGALKASVDVWADRVGKQVADMEARVEVVAQ